jgi:hypothetical protein
MDMKQVVSLGHKSYLSLTFRQLNKLLLLNGILFSILLFVWPVYLGLFVADAPYQYLIALPITCGIIHFLLSTAKTRTKTTLASRFIHEIRTKGVQTGDLRCILYLRSFKHDQFVGYDRKNRIPAVGSNGLPLLDQPRPSDWELEEKLSFVLDHYGIFVAVGSDSYSVGAARIVSTDETWQQDVEALMERAQVIICVPGTTLGSILEVELLSEKSLLTKTVFVNPGDNLIQMRGSTEFSTERFKSELREDGPYYRAPQPTFWADICSAYKTYNFPSFQPAGEWFILENFTQENGSRSFRICDHQKWRAGESPELDLLAILQRRHLLDLKALDARRVRQHVSC